LGAFGGSLLAKDQAMTHELAPLSDLAASINREHRQCQSAAEFALKSALEVGRFLTEAKSQVEHGEWLTWVADNLDFGERQAQSYMRLFTHKREIEARNTKSTSHLQSLSGALDLIREPRTVEVVIGPSEDKKPVEIEHVPVVRPTSREIQHSTSAEVFSASQRARTPPTRYYPPQPPHRKHAVMLDYDEPDDCARELYHEFHDGETPGDRWRVFVEEVLRLDSERPDPAPY
jgi:hypothetical protein